jgi:hypothetical protein
MNGIPPSWDSSELFGWLATTYNEIQDLLKWWSSLPFEDEWIKYYIYTSSRFTVPGYNFEPVICISSDKPESPRIVIGMWRKTDWAADRFLVWSSLPIGGGQGYLVPNMIEVSDVAQLGSLWKKLDFYKQKILEVQRLRAEEVAARRQGSVDKVGYILDALPGGE